jgi:hypothetical protein
MQTVSQATVLAAFLLCGSTGGAAGAQDYATTSRGSYTLEADRTNPDLPSDQTRAGLKAADTLLVLLKNTDLFRNRAGVNVSAWREVNVDRGAWGAGRPYYYGVGASVSLLVWEQDGVGKRHLSNSAAISVLIRVNGIPCAPIDNDGDEPDGGPPVSESRDNGARITGAFRGHDIYDGQCVFVRRTAEMPIMPLTKERYLKIEIARLQGRGDTNRARMKDDARFSPDVQKAIRAARMRADSGLSGRGREVQARLNAMSPAERRRQAAVQMHGVDGESLADVDSADALPLVQMNLKFFDPTLAATAPQVIQVVIPGMQKGVTPFGFDAEDDAFRHAFAVGARLRDQLDWSALDALVRRSPK